MLDRHGDGCDVRVGGAIVGLVGKCVVAGEAGVGQIVERSVRVQREGAVFDLICHVVYDQPPLTRRERAKNVKKRDAFTKYGEQARAVLDALLDKYAAEGLAAVEDLGILRVQPLSDLGTPVELVKHFGGKDGYVAAVRELEAALYDTAA